MASTRNKNTAGNYSLEQNALKEQRQYLIYKNAGNGAAYTNHFAGDGLLMGRMPSTQLSQNSTEIESFLYGIGSTNLVTPLPDLTPEFKSLDSLSIMNRLPVIIPEPLQIEPNQRPLWS